MEIHQIILLSLSITYVSSKKYAPSSDESIENLLYYKDCQINKDQASTTTPMPDNRIRSPLSRNAMDCPFPKMCCAMTCGNECSSPSFDDNIEKMDRMRNNNQVMSQSFPEIQPPMQPGAPQAAYRGRKRVKHPLRLQNIQMQQPIAARRDFGFTKDRIKSLINKDDDIRKILKDLVRVTMKKVDLVDHIKARRAAVSKPPPASHSKSTEEENDDDDDLE